MTLEETRAQLKHLCNAPVDDLLQILLLRGEASPVLRVLFSVLLLRIEHVRQMVVALQIANDLAVPGATHVRDAEAVVAALQSAEDSCECLDRLAAEL